MAVDTNLADFNDKKVVIVHNEDGKTEATETEGTVQGANEQGVLLKPKGKTNFQLITKDKIVEIRLAPDTAKNIGQRKLKIITLGQARQHLADRHGYTLEQVNALTEEAAFTEHNKIDHAKLGHLHSDAKADDKAADEAAAS
ncbi:MAG TPA: hypothetical protein VIY48_15025 [Candidatus Paceibacterota bacterium]